jgi:serine/threonine protein kinase
MEKILNHNTPDKSSNHSNTSTASTIVGVHYQVGKKLGEGSFGIIYEGLNLLNNQSVAIKFEPRKSEVPQLRDEYRTYKILAGTCKFFIVFFRSTIIYRFLFFFFSRCTECLLLWSRRTS